MFIIWDLIFRCDDFVDNPGFQCCFLLWLMQRRFAPRKTVALSYADKLRPCVNSWKKHYSWDNWFKIKTLNWREPTKMSLLCRGLCKKSATLSLNNRYHPEYWCYRVLSLQKKKKKIGKVLQHALHSFQQNRRRKRRREGMIGLILGYWWETFRPLRGFVSLRIADWRSPWEGETSLTNLPSLSDILHVFPSSQPTWILTWMDFIGGRGKLTLHKTNSSPSAPAHFLSETTFRPGLPWSSSGRNEQNEISLTYMYSLANAVTGVCRTTSQHCIK